MSARTRIITYNECSRRFPSYPLEQSQLCTEPGADYCDVIKKKSNLIRRINKFILKKFKKV